MAAAREVMRHPSVVVTDIEARMGTRFTAETLEGLRRLYPGVRFVWLMGADNLATFDRWQRWRWIMDHVPVAVLARPGQMLSAHRPKAAAIYALRGLGGREARRLCGAEPPVWCFLNVPGVAISSTEIRARGGWQR
jgi:nicotinate-nucleotide adenylyltransferase